MDPQTHSNLDESLHVMEDADGWSVVEGDHWPTAGERFETKTQAIAAARRIAVERGLEVLVHGPDGSVQERDLFVR